MAKARARPKSAAPKRLPRGRHALTPEEVLRDQRERLIDAVPRVVAERGYEAMSVADIVKAAAVSRNAFYKNFADKQECFAAAHDAGHEQLLEILAGPCEVGATIEERVQRSLAAGLDAMASDPEMARLLFVEAPSAGEEIALRYHEWLRRYGTRVSAGLRADLDFLAADPALAHLLLVESLAAARPARLEHERSLVRLAEALRPPSELSGGEVVPEETLRLLAGGLASHLSGRVLAGQAERLPEDHNFLLGFLLAPTQAADARVAAG